MVSSETSTELALRFPCAWPSPFLGLPPRNDLAGLDPCALHSLSASLSQGSTSRVYRKPLSCVAVLSSVNTVKLACLFRLSYTDFLLVCPCPMALDKSHHLYSCIGSDPCWTDFLVRDHCKSRSSVLSRNCGPPDFAASLSCRVRYAGHCRIKHRLHFDPLCSI